MKYDFVYVDAFTTTPFTGNPCAIIPQAQGLNDDQMQSFARESNLNESAFVFPSEIADFKVRFFMPRSEVNFAGHPTIATAYLLAKIGKVESISERVTIQMEFNNRVMPVEILYDLNGNVKSASMNQPAPKYYEQVDSEELADALNLPTESILGIPEVINTGSSFLTIQTTDKETLVELSMNRKKLRRLLEQTSTDVAYIFALDSFSGNGDAVGRMLDPDGTSEDPYTGSAAGGMAAYIYKNKLSPKMSFILEQGHHLDRPGMGVLDIELSGNEISNIIVTGECVKSFVGTVDL